MGFRSYIRQFLVAILMLFRPSGPCCFERGGGAVSELGKLEDGYFSMGFRSYIREFLVYQF